MVKKVVIVSVLLSSTLLLGACGNKKLEAQIASDAEYIAELEDKIENGVTIHDVGGSSIKTIEGATSDVMEYVEDKFVFPTALNIEGTTEDYNRSGIRVGSVFEVVPSNNWITKLEGVTLKLNHPSGIIGTMKALNAESLDLSEMGTNYKNLTSSLVKGVPSSDVTHSNLYIEDMIVGAMAEMSVKMKKDTNKSKLSVGVVHYGDTALTFAFLADSENLSTTSEMVRVLLSSIRYGDTFVTIE